MLRHLLGHTFSMTELLNDYQNKKLLYELVESYSAKKSFNAAFSLRAFSKKLGVSSGALTEILQKKRRVTHATAKKILINLSYSPLQAEHFLEEKKSSNIGLDRVYQDLSFDQYEVLSSWHYLALLNLIELPEEKHTVKSIAERLGLSVKKVEDSLERLLRLEMLEKVNGRFVRTFIRYQTSEDIANSAIKKYHQDTLELSEAALRDTEVELRDFSSILLKINPKNIKKVKELIRTFQDEVCELVEQDDPEEIYHMNVHLYPVSKPKNVRGKNV